MPMIPIFLLLVLIALGLPLFFAIGISSMTYFWMAGIDIALMGQRMSGAIDSLLILAIPFFFLAGELMNACKLTDRIVKLARALVGHVDGGLAQVNIFAGLIFSGISGSSTADAAALGSVLIPAMKREGYPAPFSAAVTVASSMVGPMVPPSVALVITHARGHFDRTFVVGRHLARRCDRRRANDLHSRLRPIPKVSQI